MIVKFKETGESAGAIRLEGPMVMNTPTGEFCAPEGWYVVTAPEMCPVPMPEETFLLLYEVIDE